MVRFGTRGSALALVQTDLTITRFRELFPDWDVEPRVISTEGDRDKQSPLTEIGGRGVFTNALEASVLAGEVDAAIHSAKDLPTTLHPEAPIVAFPEREDPRDVLVTRHGQALEGLPPRPVIGTSSRRRAVQILRLRRDARIVDLRGNIDTRLRKAAGNELDGIVLAAAGLLRMGWQDRITQYFPIDDVTPSPAQGALAIQAARGSMMASMLARLDDPAVSGPVEVERAYLGALGVGCFWPVGAHVAGTSAGLRLTAMIADESGARFSFADELLETGDERAHAAQIAVRLRAEVDPNRLRGQWTGVVRYGGDLGGARVVVTRPRRQAGPLTAELRQRGATPVLLPTIRIEPMADTTLLDARLRDVARGAFDWLVFTSANAVDVWTQRAAALGMSPGDHGGPRVAVVGMATAAAARAAGLPDPLVSGVSTAEGLAEALLRRANPQARSLYPRSAIGRDALPVALRRAGMDVVTVDAYRTAPEDDIDPDALDLVRRGEIDLITFASPSSVRAFVSIVGMPPGSIKRIPVVCAGPVTLEAAKDAGFAAASSADDVGAEAMAEAVVRRWRVRTDSGETSSELQMAGAGAGIGAMGRSDE